MESDQAIEKIYSPILEESGVTEEKIGKKIQELLEENSYEDVQLP